MNKKKLTVTGPTIQGVGVGLRSCHYHHIIKHRPSIPWFEAISDNFMVDGGPALQYLDVIREHYPLVLHGVGMSLGSVDPINQNYLQQLKQLIQRYQPAWVSDHLCWISTNGHYFHDLLPLPFAQETINHLVSRIKQVQDYLGTQILIENVSSYFEYQKNEMTEWEFINVIAEKADCYVLLDINNIYVSAFNHGFDPKKYLMNISKHRVKQFHLAGFEDKGRYLFDHHGDKIHPSVWELYECALDYFGAVPTLIEWDQDIPKFSILQTEAKKAQQLMDKMETKCQSCC